MKYRTPFLIGLSRTLFGRPPRSPLADHTARLAAAAEPSRLAAACKGKLPDALLLPAAFGDHSRDRVFSLSVTFYAFLSQVLTPGSSCRDVVRHLQAWFHSSNKTEHPKCTGPAYSTARAKLPLDILRSALNHLADRLEANAPACEHWCGRVVKVVDGTSVSMPDTPLNQAAYPQSSSQKPGCGFPVMRLVGVFSLASGALVDFASDCMKAGESVLFARIWRAFNPGDVALADRGFCSYAAIAGLSALGVDCVLRLSERRNFRAGKTKSLGAEGSLHCWKKPRACPKTMTREEFAALPESIVVRVVEINVAAAGFRTESFVLVTSLLDPKVYSRKKLADLYLRRWEVELHFREIKTTMGMEVLRCLSPRTIERECLMHLIAYNLVRSVMQEAAIVTATPLARISYKGSLDTIRHWSPLLDAASSQPRKHRALIAEMLTLIAADKLPARPGRSEPRAKKRRPKNYQLLTKPRKEMGHLPHRNRPQESYRPLPPKTPLS